MTGSIHSVGRADTAPTHTRQANWGSLMSAIRRGDASAAETASTALRQGEGKGQVPKGRAEIFAALEGALQTGGIEAARKVLEGGKKAAPVEQPAVPAAPVVPTTSQDGASGSVDILV
ncbi:hypothetical protein [Novosphingobium sp. JCM 18896]|uniref:hypothetical protein n=1 Tax=Novosphingobium sp. JCM 18896 TaxID=2989731 RepID=UPI00222321B0|nr:hypothetical protein [Novosphingobium sp. JCM 18896]MCW1430682.1 hypothetical protein [Novosphingobium sp. JCM 18896]